MPFVEWRSRLEAACRETALFRQVATIDETPSTQDAPETLGATPGTVVTAWRQTAGRGRFGREWIDGQTAGVAATFVVGDHPPERLAIAGAVAVAEALEVFLGRRIGLKWPNDAVVDGAKLAGVLVERGAGTARIGIGVNVAQRAFPPSIESRATSLAMLGAEPDRVEVVSELVRSLDRALANHDGALVDAFLARDALRGTRALFATPDGPVEGEVRSVDPMRGLAVRTEKGTRFLPAATTSVAEWAHSIQGPQGTGGCPPMTNA